MERQMIGVTLIREQTGDAHILVEVEQGNWRWPGDMMHTAEEIGASMSQNGFQKS